MEQQQQQREEEEGREEEVRKEEEMAEEQQPLQKEEEMKDGQQLRLQIQEHEQEEKEQLLPAKEGELQLQNDENEKKKKEEEHQLHLADIELQKNDLQLPKEKEKEKENENENDVELSKMVEEKQQELGGEDLQVHKEEEEVDNLQLPEEKEEEEEEDNLQLTKEDDLQLQEKENNLQLPKEEQQLLDEKDLQSPKEDEQEEKDYLELNEDDLQKNEEDNLQLPRNEQQILEEKDLQSPKEDEQEEKDNLELKEDDLQKNEEDLDLTKADRAGIEEDVEEKDFDNSSDNSTHYVDDDQSEKIQDLDVVAAGPPSPSPAVTDAETGVVGSEDTAAAAGDGDDNMEDVEEEEQEEEEVATEEDNVLDVSKGKKKRGRILAKIKPPPQRKKKKYEEDVCFICYDGGSIVLCDRRGCPKAYHPACIKRDESFFQSRAKWNCDWHICSSCQKASHYMCYSCAYSLCKGCTKDADYVCVRGNKGFCGACMRTIMLIENITPGNTEMVQVDFDDKNSWEYLFKDYWIDLKDKLSLTVDELTKAKNPWKGDEQPKPKNSGKGIGGVVASKEVSSGELYHADDDKDPSLDNGGNAEGNRSKRRKTKDQAKVLNKQNSLVMEDSDVEEVTPLTEGAPWATKELLDFVAHMKNGDTSMVSQFDVQALLVEYVKRNNLRDPRQKSQIICDSRLRNLFGQLRVGHFEMLKLVENHFLIKEKSPADDSIRMGVSDAIGSEAEAAGSSDSRNDRRRKTRKKTDGRRSHANPNSDEYAAIDVNNINLLYLKRNLIENLMDDTGKFHEMVVGSFVRIRISGSDQKQNMYRLVPVVGTSRVDESYKVGSRTTDTMLEILNLDKKEAVSIDGISNQEFLEDECRRLRQSIKCGLIKPLKVGEIQEKAMALRPIKVNDSIQAETARLNHLRDRASETGRRKQLRECVEKLEILKTPKERLRRLRIIPDVHIDPKMDPSYESEEDVGESDEKKRGDYVRPRSTGFGRKVLDRNSSIREADLNDVGSRAQKNLATASEQSRNISATRFVERESKWSQGGGAFGLNNQNTSKKQLSPTGLVTSDSGRAGIRSESRAQETAAAILSLSSAREVSHSDFETEKMWLYQDPSGKIQGPFSVVQLRKWSTKGHFPPHFRVWRTNEKQDDSILLSDVLDGRFPRRP